MKFSSINSKQRSSVVKKGKKDVITSQKRRTAVRSSIKRYGKRTLREILLSKTFHTGFKVIMGLSISASALYGAYAFIGDSIAHDVVISQSEILTRVSKHTPLPEGEPDAVVRVQDPESLRNQNELYGSVKEGDYIIMYPTLAIVYDLRKDQIIALKSVRK